MHDHRPDESKKIICTRITIDMNRNAFVRGERHSQRNRDKTIVAIQKTTATSIEFTNKFSKFTI